MYLSVSYHNEISLLRNAYSSKSACVYTLCEMPICSNLFCFQLVTDFVNPLLML